MCGGCRFEAARHRRCSCFLAVPSAHVLCWPYHQSSPADSPPQDCLRALLAVLMNLTQNNPAGCAAVVDAGALAPVAALLGQMVRGGPKIKSKTELS